MDRDDDDASWNDDGDSWNDDRDSWNDNEDSRNDAGDRDDRRPTSDRTNDGRGGSWGSGEPDDDWSGDSGGWDQDGDAADGPSHDDDTGLLSFALGFPGRNGVRTVIVGAVVGLFFWLLVPMFILAGYYVRLTAAAARGEPNPPEFDDWGGMFVDGIGLFLVLIPVMVVYGLVLFTAMEVSVGLYFLVSLLGAYVLPTFYINYSVNDSWAATYDLDGIRELLTSQTYLIGVILYVFVINGIGAVVAAFLFGITLLTIVGWIILWPMIYFYWIGIDAALWGRVYNRIQAA